MDETPASKVVQDNTIINLTIKNEEKIEEVSLGIEDKLKKYKLANT